MTNKTLLSITRFTRQAGHFCSDVQTIYGNREVGRLTFKNHLHCDAAGTVSSSLGWNLTAGAISWKERLRTLMKLQSLGVDSSPGSASLWKILTLSQQNEHPSIWAKIKERSLLFSSENIKELSQWNTHRVCHVRKVDFTKTKQNILLRPYLGWANEFLPSYSTVSLPHKGGKHLNSFKQFVEKQY